MAHGSSSITAGQFAQFISIFWLALKDMDSVTAQNLLDDPKYLVQKLSYWVRKNEIIFPTFMTIPLGIYESVGILRLELANGFWVDPWAKELLGRIQLSMVREQIELVVVSVSELGFEEATLGQVYSRARELGLGLCSPEVGPLFRLAYRDQPLDERLILGMKTTPGSSFRLLSVSHDRNRGLCLNADHPDDTWDGTVRFIFRR